MKTRISERDWQALSAYLDGQLSARERARLEQKLQTDADLRAALDDLRRTQQLLRRAPRLRAPRNFSLTPQMVGRPVTRPSRPLYPFMRLATVLATALFLLVVGGDYFFAGQMPGAFQQGERSVPAAAPAILEAAPQAQSEQPAATEAPPATALAAKAPSMPLPTQAPSLKMAPPSDVYPPPEEAPMTALGGAAAVTSTLPITPTISPTPTLPLSPTSTPELTPSLPEAYQPPPGQPQWPGWRILEITLAVLALGTGILSILIRRSSPR